MKAKKEKKDNILKRWYKLVEPNKGVWFGQIFFYTIYTVFLYLITIFAAKTINCMYSQEWGLAFFYLAMELMTIVIRNLAINFEYHFYAKQIASIRHNVAKKIYNKILSLDENKINEETKEKVVSIALNSMSDLSEFPDAVAGFLAYSIQVAVTLITVFTANLLAGVLVAILGVVNFFAYYNFNKKMAKHLMNRHEATDAVFNSYSKIMGSKAVINEYHMGKKYQDELTKNMDKYSKEYGKYYKTYSAKNNLYYAFWNIVVYAITALMLFFVSKGTLGITIYLIIVPYLKSCTEKLNSLFDKTSALENMRVDVDRVNIILDLDDKQIIKYGKLNKNSEAYNLGIIGVNFDNKFDDGGSLQNVDISFKMNAINVIKGERGSGKRSVFNLLRRKYMPDSGKVLLDNLDLYYYNEKTFKNHIDYCSSHPKFIRGSIKENLLVTKKKFKEVRQLCVDIGVDGYIRRLSHGYDTPIDEIKSSGMLFMIGFVRALLSKCKILMIYELPEDTPDVYRKKINKFLKDNIVDKTLILFSHADYYDDIASMIYQVENGKIKSIKAKK